MCTFWQYFPEFIFLCIIVNNSEICRVFDSWNHTCRNCYRKLIGGWWLQGWLGLQDHAATELHDQDMPVITGATILSSSMNVVQRKRGRSMPMNARAKLGYENVSKPRSKFCSFCRGKGHTASWYPSKGGVPKTQRKVPKCTKCGLSGHERISCSIRMFILFSKDEIGVRKDVVGFLLLCCFCVLLFYAYFSVSQKRNI